MKSLRLETIASFVEPEDKVIDIGCDHAYLPIFLIQKKICQKVIASDIHEEALKIARKNIEKNHLMEEIPLYLSDGLKNVPDKDINTIIIAGMGTNTILHILSSLDPFSIDKLIIQANNDLPLLRKELRKKKFFLQKEKIVYEKNHYYIIGIYSKNARRLTSKEKYFGPYDASNHGYYISLYNHFQTINHKLSWKKNTKEKFFLFLKIQLLKKYL